MKIYHGTSSKYKETIKAEGLKPRSRRKGNWTVASNPKAVYLTDAYGLHFAVSATNKEPGMILEIDTDKLNLSKLCPDEDVLEQVNRGRDFLSSDWNMEQRTAYYRKKMAEYDQWDVSLRAMGTCAYIGTIPSEAITRACMIDFEKMVELVMKGYDPSISILNYSILGERYRDFSRWLFGEDISLKNMLGEPQNFTRDGILIEEFRK